MSAYSINKRVDRRHGLAELCFDLIWQYGSDNLQ